jgi:hypothetical protein
MLRALAARQAMERQRSLDFRDKLLQERSNKAMKRDDYESDDEEGLLGVIPRLSPALDF